MAEVDINGRRIRRKARVRWTEESVKFLLHLWKSVFAEMQTAKTKWPLYINMAKKMSQRGYHFNATEIKFKIHNLTNRYRAERKKLRTYNLPESDWDIYKPLDYLLGDDETYEWESPNDDYEDPLDDIQDGADKEMEGEDNFMKTELEDGHFQNEPKVEVEVDANQMRLNFSSSDKEDEQSETECVSKSEDRVTKPNPGEQSRFRIIADRIKPSTNHSNSYKVNTSKVTNAGRTSFIPERFSKQLTAEKSNAQTLNLARLELIQLQKDNALKEMEYRRLEFEQKSEEHKLRLKHMEEEHQLRMQSLRNQSTVNENKFYESL